MRRQLSVLSAATVGLSLCGMAAPAVGAVPGDRTGVSMAAPSVAGPHRGVAEELLVGYVATADAPARDRARGRAGGRLADRVVRGAAGRPEVELVRLPRGADQATAVRALEEDPAVSYAEPNWTYTRQATSSDPAFTNGYLWGMYGRFTRPTNTYGSNAAAAWAAGRTGSARVYVGVIDEGIQHNHPDLSGQVRNPGESFNGVDDDRNGYVDDVHGWDFVNNNKTVYDGGTTGGADDHGTHVAGTIGAKANGRGVVGVNWNVGLISGKFLTANGGSAANAVRAIDYFTNLKKRGVNIVATNNSWGGGGYSQAVKDAIDRANLANIVFVAAAGNGGGDGIGDNNDATANYPASYFSSNVIAVAAITKTGGRAAFSNYGATSVDLGAPGVDIWSTTAYNGYSAYSGTSMAAPHVTGAVALYASVKPWSSAAAIKRALLTSAVPTPALTGKTVSGARLDVNAALSR